MILFLYGRNMRSCLRALVARLFPVMSELLRVLEPISDHRAHILFTYYVNVVMHHCDTALLS